MNNIVKTNNNKKNFETKKAIQKQKSVSYRDGEKIITFTKLKILQRSITLKEKTIYQIKNAISFMSGILFVILFYIKPNNFKELINIFAVIFEEIKKAIIFITPFARNFPSTDNFLYLIKVSLIICIVLALYFFVLLNDFEPLHKKIKVKFIISLMAFLGVWYIDCFASLLFIKITFLFKILSVILICILSLIIYFILCILLLFVLENQN